MEIIEGFTAAREKLSRRIPSLVLPVSAGLRRSLQSMFGTEDPGQAVGSIIAEVREKGDRALIELTQRIDGIKRKKKSVYETRGLRGEEDISDDADRDVSRTDQENAD